MSMSGMLGRTLQPAQQSKVTIEDVCIAASIFSYIYISPYVHHTYMCNLHHLIYIIYSQYDSDDDSDGPPGLQSDDSDGPPPLASDKDDDEDSDGPPDLGDSDDSDDSDSPPELIVCRRGSHI